MLAKLSLGVSQQVRACVGSILSPSSHQVRSPSMPPPNSSKIHLLHAKPKPRWRCIMISFFIYMPTFFLVPLLCRILHACFSSIFAFEPQKAYLFCFFKLELWHWIAFIPSILIPSIDNMLSFFFLMFTYFLWETEHERERRKERGRRRIQSRLQNPSCQHRAGHGARTHEPWHYDLNWSRTPDWLSHPGAPKY